MTAASTTREKIFARIIRLCGLDVHVVNTLLLRIWSVLAGGTTAMLIPTYLNPSQQGYYYTFTAVIATQIFFELGLNHVLVQLTSHAAAHLQRVSDVQFEGDVRWRLAITSLITLSTKWNAVMASIFFFALLIGGSWFFSTKGTLQTEQWLAPWIVLIGATAGNLAMSARLAICEGLGEVSQIARLRIAQSLAGYALLWTLLVSGAGMWAAVAIPASSVAGTAWWLRQRRLKASLNIKNSSDSMTDGAYKYSRDIFPLQWRIALSWASGYFIFSFLTPVVFAKQGEIEAGKLGLALTIFAAISTVGMSWISAKIPALSTHIARKERAQLDSLFNRQAILAVGSTIISVTCFLLVVKTVEQYELEVIDRLPSMTALILLSIATIANTTIFSMASYMRAHKEEPMLANSICTAFLIGVGVYVIAGIGLTATVVAYTTVITFIGLPWCAILFNQYRQRSE